MMEDTKDDMEEEDFESLLLESDVRGYLTSMCVFYKCHNTKIMFVNEFIYIYYRLQDTLFLFH